MISRENLHVCAQCLKTQRAISEFSRQGALLELKSFDKMSKAKAAMEAPNIMKASCVGSTLKKYFHFRVGVRKCNAYGLDHQKCHIWLLLQPVFQLLLLPFQKATYRVLICPYYDSLGKKEQSTCDTFKGPDCTFDKVHLQIHMSIISSVF